MFEIGRCRSLRNVREGTNSQIQFGCAVEVRVRARARGRWVRVEVRAHGTEVYRKFTVSDAGPRTPTGFVILQSTVAKSSKLPKKGPPCER